jgi:hypothetical protein
MLVGEPMVAPMNGFGDNKAIAYARTGMKLSASTVRHDLGSADLVSKTIPVDIPVEMSFADYAAGRDPAVDPILEGRETRGIAIIAEQDGGAAARKVYESRGKAFWGFSWWSPPSEIGLRGVTQDLLRRQRIEDALAVGELNAEIHPEIWNTASWRCASCAPAIGPALSSIT